MPPASTTRSTRSREPSTGSPRPARDTTGRRRSCTGSASTPSCAATSTEPRPNQAGPSKSTLCHAIHCLCRRFAGTHVIPDANVDWRRRQRGAVDPLGEVGGRGCGGQVDRRGGGGGALDERGVLGSDEARLDRMGHEVEQRTEEAGDVEEHHGHRQQSELVPREQLERLVERAEPAGQARSPRRTAPPSGPCVRASNR